MEENERNVINIYEGAQYVNHIDSQTNNYHYYGKSSKSESLLTDNELRERINNVICDIKIARHWFSVVKVLMLRGQVKSGDFVGAAERIKSLYPAGLSVDIDPVDLQSMHHGSFALPIDRWSTDDGPIKREGDFRNYILIARRFDDLFK